MPFKDVELRRMKQRQYSKDWYTRNREGRIQKSREQKDKIRTLWTEYKASKRCSHCGVQHPAVIDFHHVIRENKQSVNDLITRGKLRAAIREAEDKCIPLCSNCHRIHHWNEHRRREKRRRKKWAQKKTYST